ncbi:macrophage mannose receptor 1-like isoform X1 [Gadus macrocephalus]|uniref:macrophage mannose receptor 1-like isoform X1 n=1 Tax=Gadus macrocephalus TaxID=80720 RepID=UPI0028CB55FA|nr:macrophage mannose receptor 1-like isoform X1 [Gadus macrocephalus]
MEPVLELDPGPPEEPEDTSLDRRQTRKGRSVLKLYVCVALLCFLQATLNISLRLHSATSWTKGREHLMDSLGGVTRRGWLYFDQSLYFISTTKKTWMASRDFCLDKDADLLVINSKEEKGLVAKLERGSWIGLQIGRETKGIYKWVDGTNLTSSTGHALIFPSSFDGCAVTADQLDMRSCDSRKNWICEKVNVLEHLEAELNKEGMPNEKEEEEEEEVPAITAFKDNYIGSLGDTVILYCRASGQPKPTIEWLYNGRPVKRDRTDNKPEPLVFVEGEDLIVRSARPGVDTISCLANNSAGTANKTAMLLVVELTPEGWRIFNQSLYFVSMTKRNWTASRDDCLQRNADLVVINSKVEEELATKWWLRTWIGLRLDRDTEGTWKWVDGTNVTSSSWLSGEPYLPTITEACALGDNSQLIPTPCASQNHWICEKTV